MQFSNNVTVNIRYCITIFCVKWKVHKVYHNRTPAVAKANVVLPINLFINLIYSYL
jgi:hypothetical protein